MVWSQSVARVTTITLLVVVAFDVMVSRRMGLQAVITCTTSTSNLQQQQTTTEGAGSKPSPSVFNSSLMGGLSPRAFPSWPHGHANLCTGDGFNPPLPFPEKIDQDRGMIFVKTEKTGSSTTSGVNLRIQRNLATRLKHKDTFCPGGFSHQSASDVYAKRDPQTSFLWTILREPTKRMQSQFFHFYVSRRKMEPNNQNFQQHLLQQRDNYIVRLPYQKYEKSMSHDERMARMQSVIDQYDFIAITERLEESLVVLQMLLDLPADDLLYLNVKSSGGFDDGLYQDRCYYIVPKFVSPGMKTFLASPEWQAAIQYERSLYHAAHRSLDMTIARLGPEFYTKLEEFQELRQRATRQCTNVQFPCSSEGEKIPFDQLDCLWADSGCGATCLDKVVADAKTQPQQQTNQTVTTGIL